MTLRMVDGPVANLPPGFDAYAGYVNRSGIGVTWPAVAAIPAEYHLSITTDGAPAMCADVEKGAMSNWRGYTWGYCAISNAASLIGSYGRPPRLWTAHYTGVPHICSPACGFGLVYADGTQWTDHGGAYDESLLNDNFFTFAPIAPPTTGNHKMYYTDPVSGQVVATDANGNLYANIPTLTVCTLGEHPSWQAGSAESGGANPCVGITAWLGPDNQWGYCYITAPTSGKGGFGPYDLYHVLRNGTPH